MRQLVSNRGLREPHHTHYSLQYGDNGGKNKLDLLKVKQYKFVEQKHVIMQHMVIGQLFIYLDKDMFTVVLIIWFWV